MAALADLPEDVSELISSQPTDCQATLGDLHKKYNFGEAELECFTLNKGSLTADKLVAFAQHLEEEKQRRAPKKLPSKSRGSRKGDSLKRRLAQAVGLSSSSVASPATAGALRARSAEDRAPQGKRAREASSTNDFNDRQDSDLDEGSSHSYTLGGGYRCDLTGWTHTRSYAMGFVRDKVGDAFARVSGLTPGARYAWKIYQFASLYGGVNPLFVNGISQGRTTSKNSSEPTAEGVATADLMGVISFQFTRESYHVHLSGLSISQADGTGEFRMGPTENLDSLQTLQVSLKSSINAGKLEKTTTHEAACCKLRGDNELWTGDRHGAYTWMDEAVADRAAKREHRLQEFESRMAATLEALHSESGATLGMVGVPSQAETFICGRVLCEGLEGRLNERSILLEGSRASGKVARVQLNVAECPTIAAFPGQIIGVLGRSGMTGVTFHAREFLAGLPGASDLMALDRSLHCMVAAGPFCLRDNLDYAPLESILAHAAKERPEVLILLGPFLDANNHKVIAGETTLPGEKEPCSFEEVYARHILPLLARGLAPLRQKEAGSTSPATEVLILPSLDEVLCFHPLPQPPLDVLLGAVAPMLSPAMERLKRLGARFLPNPAHVDLKGIQVSLTSADALSPLLREIVLRPEGRKIEEALRLLLLQQSLFPVVPRDPPQVSEARAAALDFPDGARPQLVMFPSIAGNATGLFVDDTVFVNPGPLCRPAAFGSFAEFWIAPSTGAARLQDRVRVDIQKLG
eukprot:TRINITY_DN5799_c0_g1_i1.p1 TRINITY_DN5799_c0_g1~~TRINITY_DN5799_c0_g1_i1.p1  ORF type:complete len:749 (+),score=108.20 TRINITY_DN5799_c0_g1_i1:97-2343(+)